MTNPTPLTDEDEARSAWLLRLSIDQVARYDTGTICDWLDARREQHIARLRAACRTLRELCDLNERAHARIAAALTAVPAPAGE